MLQELSRLAGAIIALQKHHRTCPSRHQMPPPPVPFLQRRACVVVHWNRFADAGIGGCLHELFGFDNCRLLLHLKSDITCLEIWRSPQSPHAAILSVAHRDIPCFSAKMFTCKRDVQLLFPSSRHTDTQTRHTGCTRYTYVSGTDLTEPATFTALPTSFMGFCTAAGSGRLASKDIVAASWWVLVGGLPSG